jgi:prepilin-type processing-associated H-X9-DG protein
MKCSNNLKQLAVAVHSYHDVIGRFPENGSVVNKSGCCDPHGQPQWSWMARILPYVEQQALYNQLRVAQNIPPGHSTNQALLANTVIQTFRCPSDITPDIRTGIANWNGSWRVGSTSYKGVSGGNWAWGNYPFTPPGWNNDGLDNGNGIFWRTDVKRSLTMSAVTNGDGTANTLMIGEDIGSMNIHNAWPYSNTSNGTCAVPLNLGIAPLTAPAGQNFTAGNWPNVYSFRSLHTQGANFALADGSVRFIRQSIPLANYRAGASWSGRETLPLE